MKGGRNILLVDNADVSAVATNIKYQSNWNNGASTFTFEYPTVKGKLFANGSTVIFTYNGANIFYGFLFKTQISKQTYKCTAYDQLRYLKAKNSLMRQIEPLDSFLNVVAGTIGDRIRIGQIDSTEIPLGKYLFDNKTYLDMLYQSIQDNLVANSYYYTLRDNFGALDLRDTLDLRLPLIIGDNSLATDFDYSLSIDDDTYNYVKVAADNKDAGVREVYIAEDSSNIGKWGKLMLYEKVDSAMNAAQITERANMLLALKNKETETLKVDSIGDVRVFGGSGVKIEISQANLNMWAIVDSVTHKFERSQHTMTMNLVFGRWY